MICPECGKEFTGRKRKYCSRDCMWEYQRKERKEKSEAKRRRICKWCGKEFIMSWYSGKGGRGETKEGQFCSRKCKNIARKYNNPNLIYLDGIRVRVGSKCKIYYNHCRVCGNLFANRYSSKEYCSDECKEIIHLKNMRNKYWNDRIKKESFRCEECGKYVVLKYGNRRLKRFCSKKCCNRNNGRIVRHVRRARKHNNGYEVFNPIDVFKRDGWRCQLCGVKTPKKLRGTIKDNAPELDHIVSLANGGEHSMRNTQCLCRKCNHSKGIKTLGQLRLYG